MWWCALVITALVEARGSLVQGDPQPHGKLVIKKCHKKTGSKKKNKKTGREGVGGGLGKERKLFTLVYIFGWLARNLIHSAYSFLSLKMTESVIH